MARRTQKFAVPVSIYNKTKSATRNLSEKEHKFLCDIIVSTIQRAQRRLSLSVPMPGRKLAAVRWREFIQGRFSLLLEQPYDRQGRRCRELGLRHEALVDLLADIEEAYLGDPGKVDVVDIYTGKPVTHRKSSRKKDEKKQTEPYLIRDAMDCIECRYFNRKKVVTHIEAMRDEALKLEGQPGYEHAVARYLNDLFCWKTVVDQKPEHVSGDVYKYIPAYSVQRTGRIGEIGGGLQNATREMKEAACKGIPNLHNYDLKSSQVNGLIQQFNLRELDTTWLVDYRDNSERRSEYATKVGVDIDTWKQCLTATIMGASLSTIHHTFMKYCELNGVPLTKAQDMLDVFEEVTEEQRKPLKTWHGHLTRGYLDKNCHLYGGKRYLKNAVGKKLCIDDIKSNKASKIAAHILQGQEANFIHHLTVLSKDYGYEVIANEHDGLITIGLIPAEAVEEAIKLSGLENAVLVEKPFL